MEITKKYKRNVVVLVHTALLCACIESALAAGTLYARAIGEPPEAEPRPAPTAPRKPPSGPTDPITHTPAEPEAPPPENRMKSSSILIGLGVAAALAALGGGGGGGGGSTTSH